MTVCGFTPINRPQTAREVAVASVDRQDDGKRTQDEQYVGGSAVRKRRSKAAKPSTARKARKVSTRVGPEDGSDSTPGIPGEAQAGPEANEATPRHAYTKPKGASSARKRDQGALGRDQTQRLMSTSDAFDPISVSPQAKTKLASFRFLPDTPCSAHLSNTRSCDSYEVPTLDALDRKQPRTSPMVNNTRFEQSDECVSKELPGTWPKHPLTTSPDRGESPEDPTAFQTEDTGPILSSGSHVEGRQEPVDLLVEYKAPTYAHSQSQDAYPMDGDDFDALFQASDDFERHVAQSDAALSSPFPSCAPEEQVSSFFPTASGDSLGSFLHHQEPPTQLDNASLSISCNQSGPDSFSSVKNTQLSDSVVLDDLLTAEEEQEMANLAEKAQSTPMHIQAQAIEKAFPAHPPTTPEKSKLHFNQPKTFNNKSKTLSTSLVPQSQPPLTPRRPDKHANRVIVLETPPPSSQPASPPPAYSSPTPPSNGPKPFIRPPFPTILNSRSPIAHLRPDPVLRVCFRIGEALRAAADAARVGLPAVTELYARVMSSERRGGAQLLQFADLYRWTRPPRLDGRWVGWEGVERWEQEGRAFLGGLGAEGKICRAVGVIEKSAGGGWRMKVVSAWEADWEDVEAVKRVVCMDKRRE